MWRIVFVTCAGYCQTIFSLSWINQIKGIDWDKRIRGVKHNPFNVSSIADLDLGSFLFMPEECWYSFNSFLEGFRFSFVLLDFEGFRTLGFGHGLVNMCIVQLLSSATLNLWSDCLSIWTKFAILQKNISASQISKTQINWGGWSAFMLI